MSAYFVVIKDGAIIDCTPDNSVAVERFLSKNADRMEKVSSLEDIQRICDTDWDAESEVVITNLWSYLNERIERLGRRIKETETPTTDDVREMIEQAATKLCEVGQQRITELRELLNKLRAEEPKKSHAEDQQKQE